MRNGVLRGLLCSGFIPRSNSHLQSKRGWECNNLTDNQERFVLHVVSLSSFPKSLELWVQKNAKEAAETAD